MILVEKTGVPGASLPVAAFREHLLLGTGFADDAVQDGLLENYLRAAMAAIEGRIGKILFRRGFTWELPRWREPFRQPVPIAPVMSVDGLRMVDRDGAVTAKEPSLIRLQRDAHRPVLWGHAGLLPAIPVGGLVEIDLTAGYGAGWGEIPADLQQAMLMLAAYFYENRQAPGTGEKLPGSVAGLIEPYRALRLSMGAAP